MAVMYPTENHRIVDFLDAFRKFGDLKLKAVNEEMLKVFQELSLYKHVINMHEKLSQTKINEQLITEERLLEIVKLMVTFEKATALILANYDDFSRLNNDPQIVSKVMKILYGRAD